MYKKIALCLKKTKGVTLKTDFSTSNELGRILIQESNASTQQVRTNFIYAFFPYCTDDFRVVENEVYNQDWRSRGKLQIFQYQALKWALALFVGLVVALVGFFSNIAVENIAGFKLLLTSDLMLKNRY